MCLSLPSHGPKTLTGSGCFSVRNGLPTQKAIVGLSSCVVAALGGDSFRRSARISESRENSCARGSAVPLFGSGTQPLRTSLVWHNVGVSVAARPLGDASQPAALTSTSSKAAGLSETNPKHPAKYSAGLLPVFADLLTGCSTVLDPFAGTGRVHQLRALAGCWTVGVEIEPEWAAVVEGTLVADALRLPFVDAAFDAVCTSPTYGNRLADHHQPRDVSYRRSYQFDMGRQLNAANSGLLQWGEPYREFHRAAWSEINRVLNPVSGRLVLNLKDHVRDGQIMPVTGFHVEVLQRLGLTLRNVIGVAAPSHGRGANRQARAGNAEIVFLFSR